MAGCLPRPVFERKRFELLGPLFLLDRLRLHLSANELFPREAADFIGPSFLRQVPAGLHQVVRSLRDPEDQVIFEPRVAEDWRALQVGVVDNFVLR